jgi:hypothetical protein
MSCLLYDFETTQYTKFSENATEHITNLVCVQQFFQFVKCKMILKQTVNAVVGDAIHSSTTLSRIYYLISVNPGPGVIKSCRLFTTQRLLILSLIRKEESC